MRCKNCGSENEDNLYICQNCGSPLYDEEDDGIIAEDDLGKTRVAPIVQPSQRTQQPAHNSGNKSNNKDNTKKKEKEKTVIAIVVLAVVLTVVIAVLAVVLVTNSKMKNDVEETSFPITVSTTKEQSTSKTTTAPTTTQTTTQSTTESTTAVANYSVSVSCSQGGEVEGDGTYTQGDKCTVIARADDDYEFDGWYKNGKRVSSNEVYSFSVNGDTELEAVFTEVSETDYYAE